MAWRFCLPHQRALRYTVYACELWGFAMCPALRGSTVSYAGDAHFPKHSLEYSLNFWSQSKKKKEKKKRSPCSLALSCNMFTLWAMKAVWRAQLEPTA